MINHEERRTRSKGRKASSLESLDLCFRVLSDRLTPDLSGLKPVALGLLILLLAMACVRTPTERPPEFDPAYRAWNHVLARHASDRGVEYAGIQADPAPLALALEELRVVTPDDYRGWSRAARLAFLINAHNAHAVARILKHWPVDSIEATRLLGSARNRRDIRLLDRRWSLKSLAEEIMSERHLRSRAIFLLNWAEAGCASLPDVAATAENLDYLLDRQTRRMLADARWCQYDWRQKRIRLTPLINWHHETLERDFTTLWFFLERYLPKDMAVRAKMRPPRIGYMKFDRSLNVVNRTEESVQAEVAVEDE